MSAETDSPSGAVSASQLGDAEPTPTVGGGEQTASHPAGSARPEGGVPVTERPEALVGAAFAGGLVVALIFRKIVG